MNEEPQLLPPPTFGTNGDVTQPTLDSIPTLLPKSSSEVNAIPSAESLSKPFAQAGAVGMSPATKSYMDKNVQGDVPIDRSSGIPFMAYLATEENRLESEKEKYLKNIFGEQSVRRDTEGKFLVRIPDSERPGKFKDVPLKKEGMSLNDFADLAIQSPEIANGIMATFVGGKGKGFLNAMKKIGQMAIAQEATGAIKDIGAQIGQDISQDQITIKDSDHPLGQILKGRAQATVVDAAFGAVLGGTGKVLAKARSPFASDVLAPVTADFKESANLLQQHFGFQAEQFPSEATGSGLLAKIESFTSKLPGSSAVFDAIMKKRAEFLQKIQNVMRGLSATPSDAELAARTSSEDIGEDAFGVIRSKVQGLKDEVSASEKLVEAAKEFDKNKGTEAVSKAEQALQAKIEAEKKAAMQRGTEAIKSSTGQEAVKSSQDVVDREAIGKSLLDKAEAMRSEFKGTAAAKYDAVFEHPLAKEKNIPAKSIADWADETIASMPKKNTVSEEVGYDAYGSPVAVQTEKTETLQEFIPTGVLGKLKQLSSLRDQKLSLSELKDMRTEVNNAIKQGEALPGVQTHYLSGMAKTLTETINNLDKHIKDPSLKKLFDEATTYYRQNAPKFEEATIAPLFRDVTQAGRPGPVGVVEQAISDPDKWIAYRNFFGKNSPEVEGLKNAARNDLVRKSFDDLNGTINAKEFLGRLKAIVDNTPEIAKEIYGNTVFGLKQIADAMERVPSTAKLPSSEVEKLMKSSNMTGMALNNLRRAQEALDRQYRSKLVRQIAGNKIDADTFNPSEFVQRFAKTADIKEINQVMGLLKDRPDLINQIKHQTLEDIFNASSVPNRYASVGDAIRGDSGMLNSEKILETLGDGTQRQRYRMIIGDSAFDDVVNLAKYLKPQSIKEGSFAAAGALSSGFIINSLLKADTKYFSSFVRNFILASMYTKPMVRKFVSNTVMGPQAQAVFLQHFIASTPFLEDMAQRFGPDWSKPSHYIKQNVDALTRNLMMQATKDQGNQPTQELTPPPKF